MRVWEGLESAHLARSRWCWRTSLHRIHNQPFAACNGTGVPRPALIHLLPGDHEKEKYELKKVGRGIAYTLKPEAEGTEPPHLICARCYEGRQAIYYAEL